MIFHNKNENIARISALKVFIASRKPPGSYKKFQGRIPEIFSLVFWMKLIFHKDILKLTDLYIDLNVVIDPHIQGPSVTRSRHRIVEIHLHLHIKTKLVCVRCLSRLLIEYLYSCNKITTTQIQISRQKLKYFFANFSHQMMISLTPIVCSKNQVV